MSQHPITVAGLIKRFGLQPLPAEGGFFRPTWTSAASQGGRPTGTAIISLLTAEDAQFSAMHRLPEDEVWHFYLGDPIELLLLGPDGEDRVVTLGQDVGAGQQVQHVVPAGTWMGGRVAPPGQWSLFGCTMAPGFLPSDYEGGDAEELCRRYPRAAGMIRSLCRPGARLRMTDD